MKKIILFGSGEIGHRMLEYLGYKYFYAFCDNSIKKSEKYDGINYLSYLDFKTVYSNCITILSVNQKNAKEILNQLQSDGISDFVVYDSYLIRKMRDLSSIEFIRYFNNDLLRISWERDYYFRLVNECNTQLSYIKDISDIRNLKKAIGYTAFVQNKTMDFVKEIFELLKPLHLKIFTAAGTAIGLYRHNGFIPWDDDVDFGLFRQDYLKLLNYGKEHFVYIEIELGKKGEYKQAELFRKYPNDYIMIVSPNGAQIKRGTSWVDSSVVDFFPYDFYEDSYDYMSHEKNINECARWRRAEIGNEKIWKFMEQNAHTVKKSNICSFGLDGMDPYVCPRKGWIDKKIFFPLKKVVFEGVECYAPNRIDKYLSYCYEDFENFPDDISAIHSVERAEIMKKTYISCAIIIRKKILSDLLNIYFWLRKNGVYCVFVCKSSYLYDKDDLIDIKALLDEAGVEFVEDFLNDYDFLIVEDIKSLSFDVNIPCYILHNSLDDYEIEIKKIINNLDTEKRDLCFL